MASHFLQTRTDFVTFAGRAHTGGFAAFGANQHHIGNVNRASKRTLPGLMVRPWVCTWRWCLVRILTPCTTTRCFIREDFDHFAAFAFIFLAAGDDFNRIAFANFYIHAIAPVSLP